MVDSTLIARKIAKQMLAHRDKLAGRTGGTHRPQETITAIAGALGRHRDEHQTGAATVSAHWQGDNADAFTRRARRMTSTLDVTATAAERGATIVSAAGAALHGGHSAVVGLIDEYVAQAAPILDAGVAARKAGAIGLYWKAVGDVVDLVGRYTNESAKHLAAVREQLRDSARQLKELERGVEHDGVVDPQNKRRKQKAKSGDDQQTGSARADKITDVARGELGYQEGPGNRNKYGPAAAWCSSFATWVWRKSGVDIPTLPFTGDVYRWGQRNGLAYNATNLDEVRPGDVLLFGTGPQSTGTSTHIGIVESRNGNQVTLIEGNSSDRVQRVTHTLSPSTFYGGVHPR
jgi:peptidoglycan DL-endopeptidase CwlO